MKDKKYCGRVFGVLVIGGKSYLIICKENSICDYCKKIQENDKNEI